MGVCVRMNIASKGIEQKLPVTQVLKQIYSASNPEQLGLSSSIRLAVYDQV